VVGDSSGAPVVKAKVSSEGVGMVGTGPFFGGPIGNMGVPFMIVGKKGR
jgi:hypothetical protein